MQVEHPSPTVPGLSNLAPIGSGGFGTVYRAEDLEHDRTVAVKVLNVRGLDDAAQRAFDRERRAMGALSGHPHIVSVYRSGMTAEGHPFIVMEHMSGGSLADAVAPGPLPWPRAADIGVKIAGALQAAHALGIIHRDVKPANLLLNAWEEPKLGDFGIARMASVTTSSTHSTSASIAHAAPEVLDGRQATGASDIYSLASTLHELVSGQSPFVRAGDQSLVPIIARVLTTAPPDLRTLGIPDALAAALEEGMAKDPVDRFGSAAAFGQALGAALQQAGHAAPRMVRELTGTPVSVDAIAPADGAATPVPTRRRWLPAVLAAALGALALGVIWGLARSPASPSPDTVDDAEVVAPINAEAGEGTGVGAGPVFGDIAFRGSTDSGFRVGVLPGLDQAPIYLTDLGEVGRPALSPDGNKLAYTSGGALHVLSGSGQAAVVLVQQGARDPAWSPDGTRIAYAADRDGQLDLYVIGAIDGSQPVQLTDTPADEGSPAWSPDGELLVYDTDVAGDYDIWVTHVDGSGTLQLTSGPGDDETPTYHPDGDRIAFVRRQVGSTGNLWLVLTDGTSDPVALTSDAAEHTGPSYSPDGAMLAFASDADGDLDLYVLDVASGETQVLLGGPGLQVDPDWRRAR